MYIMKLIIFQIFTLFVLSCSTTKQESIVELDSNWEFKSENDKEYLPASVPGTVHLDLLQNGKIDDPFFRLNEHKLQWIDKLDWEYRTSFDVNDSHFNYEAIELDFFGLDTYARTTGTRFKKIASRFLEGFILESESSSNIEIVIEELITITSS